MFGSVSKSELLGNVGARLDRLEWILLLSPTQPTMSKHSRAGQQINFEILLEKARI